jgi:hypothetical protein
MWPLSKPTYAKRRTKRPAPCPEQRKADQVVREIFAKKSRAFDKVYKKGGLAEALGITAPKQTIKAAHLGRASKKPASANRRPIENHL